jgi:hypothetical protein
MSLVKVSGNASGTGTLTIAAPNTNSDYTLTLPTETGTLLSTGSTDTAWTAYTPTITSGSGTITTVSATGSYKVFGKTCWFTTNVTITTAGTGGGFLGVSLPFAQVATSLSSYGMEVNATGSMVKGLNPASGAMQVTRYDNASIIGSGYVIRTTGTYEIT